MMIRSCVTISLVPEARGGPFVFWDDLAGGCRKAKELGFDAVEVFAPGAEAVDRKELRGLLDDNGLKLAALGTGAGWVKHRLTLTSADGGVRGRAKEFIRSIISLGGEFSASAIVGSMQGRWGEGVSKEQAMGWLREAMAELGEYAKQCGVPLLFEPLNRYETNMVNTVGEGVKLVGGMGNVRLLCDLFHMNIEERDMAGALKEAGKWVGHIHFVDSNRRAAGCGHIEYGPIARALREIGYGGYVSAEAVAWPDSEEAARKTMEAYRRLFVG